MTKTTLDFWAVPYQMSTTPSQAFDGSSDAWIDYAAETREAMEAMYDVKESGAATQEGLEICRKAIEVVPSGYTAWHLYYRILLELGIRPSSCGRTLTADCA